VRAALPNEMKPIESPAEFDAVLRAVHALVFIDFEWSAQSRESRSVIERWEQDLAGRGTKVDWAVHRLAPDRQPYTWKWVAEHALHALDSAADAAGAVLWLKSGAVVARVSSAASLGGTGLSRTTRRWFPWPEAPAGSDAQLAEDCPCDPVLLKVLCCPETRQSLEPAASALLDGLNGRVDAGLLRKRNGQPVSEKLEAGLVRSDRKLLYPIRHNIPIMLMEEGIPLASGTP
jgi:uncharacterized protein YbaR (Trm112 family)